MVEAQVDYRRECENARFMIALAFAEQRQDDVDRRRQRLRSRIGLKGLIFYLDFNFQEFCEFKENKYRG